MKIYALLRKFILSTHRPILVILLTSLLSPSRVAAQPNIPPIWNILSDNFESGTLDKWQLSSPDYPVLAPGDGHYGTNGLSIDVNTYSSYIYQTDVAKAEEGYISFWFNPNRTKIPDVGTWIPGKSLSIVEIRNGTNWWTPIVDLFMRQPAGQGYQAYLAWPIENDQIYYDYDNGFPLVNGWQQITIGYHKNGWVAVWCNDELIRYATNVVHTDPYGDIVFFGNIQSTYNKPSGTIQ